MMARKREDMVSDLVNSYTTRELVSLATMIGITHASNVISAGGIGLALKDRISDKLFDPAARTQMHEPKGED